MNIPKLRVFSGKEVVKILSGFRFEVVSQRGSHVKLRRILSDGTKQALTILLHDALDKGPLKVIIRQALRYVLEEELKPYFYK